MWHMYIVKKVLYMGICGRNLRKDNVVNFECGSRCNIDGLFSSCGHIEGNPSLPLCFIENGVHCLESNHVGVHFYSDFFTDLFKLVTHISHKVPTGFIYVYQEEHKSSLLEARQRGSTIPLHSCWMKFGFHFHQGPDSSIPAHRPSQI